MRVFDNAVRDMDATPASTLTEADLNRLTIPRDVWPWP
jgi:hypothetical protein